NSLLNYVYLIPIIVTLLLKIKKNLFFIVPQDYDNLCQTMNFSSKFSKDFLLALALDHNDP
ncbi:MAG: hypothetical protein ACYSWW_28605, partial [Planctomycetota bacterium]